LHTGRPSIPPEQLLKASLLQAFFTIRSERQLMEQVNDNMLYRWFMALSADAAVWDASSFSKNRERLMEADVARRFMVRLLNLPQVKGLLSSEHFSVDGTLVDAWASMKSFVPKDGSGEPPVLHGSCAYGEQERPDRRLRTDQRNGPSSALHLMAESCASLLKLEHLTLRK
jgi:transposase